MLSVLTVAITHEKDVVSARRRARQIARLLKFPDQDGTRIGTAVSEIARNALTHGKGGRVEFAIDQTPAQSLVVRITDHGPGMDSAGSGFGIIGARRLMDDFRLTSEPGKGTCIELRKNLPAGSAEVTPKSLAAIAEQLAQEPQDIYDEIRHQNQELLNTLEDVRRRDEDLSRINRELEDTNRGVVALYAELDQRAEQLRYADRMKTRFLSHMSHEFRTPLNAIIGLSRLLLKRDVVARNTEVAKEVTFIQQTAHSLTEIVNDLLDLSKAEAGKLTVRPAETDVTSLFATLRAMLRPLAVNPAVELIFEDTSAIPVLVSDESMIAQILRNLLSNALKFTERGEVRASARYLPQPDRMSFTVSDTGIGIPREHRERIFEEYAQLDNALQDNIKGTGLGLPLCRKLAELLGGAIEVESEPGAGARFTVTIPRVFPTEQQAEPDRERTVLLIDDEEVSRYLMRRLLGPGVRIVEATTGTEGIEQAWRLRPDLIMLDLTMPDLSGFEVLDRLKRAAETRDIPVVVVTGQKLDARERESLERQTVAVLHKEMLTATESLSVDFGPPLRLTPALQEPRMTMPVKSGRLTILNVDDREINRYIRTQTLQQAGYRILEASTGTEALELFEAECPQLVLLDMNLPDLDGTEVCRRIKSRQLLCSVLVLHISASHTSVNDRVQGLESGADGYLVEPVEPELLLATVQSMLRLWKAETRLEESLAETRELAARYQSLVQAVPHVIYTATAEGKCDYVSEQFSAYTGIDTTEALGAGWLDFVHPDDREPEQQLWRRAMKTGEPYEMEFRHLAQGEKYRWNLLRARPVRNDAGRVVQWVGSVTDVHERRMLDEAVRQRHQEFVSLAEHSPDIIARLDRNLRYSYLNRPLPGMNPAAVRDYVGKTSRELGLAPEVCEVREAACRQVLATAKPVAFEFQNRLPCGTTAYYEARLVPEFRDGRVECLLSITTDITERRVAELAVAESERRLLRLVDSNVIGVVIGNEQRITFANDVFLEMVGYSRGDVQSGLSWREMTPPEYLALDDAAIVELRERGKCAPFQKDYWRRDGTRVPVLMGAAALDTPATEWACFVLDLSELKNAEGALRKTNLALQRSNTDLSQFAYAASHDLQEPLRTVGIYTQLLTSQSAVHLSPEQTRYSGEILSAVKRMQSLITNLLAFSQAQSAEFSFSELVPASQMVQGATDNLKNSIEESGAFLTWRDLPAIPADTAQFTLVFQNLISNSIKYRRPDTLPRIHISAERDGDNWVFAVRDNGIGFEQEYAERIFSPFTRLHGREFPGTGIGLAIVQKVIERHGGRVWAEGRPGEGATFFFSLPVGAADPALP